MLCTFLCHSSQENSTLNWEKGHRHPVIQQTLSIGSNTTKERRGYALIWNIKFSQYFTKPVCILLPPPTDTSSFFSVLSWAIQKWGNKTAWNTTYKWSSLLLLKSHLSQKALFKPQKPANSSASESSHACLTNMYLFKHQLTSAPKMYKESTSQDFSRFFGTTLAKLLSAYSQILLHWVRHNFIAASATFRLHSHCFSLSLFEEWISSMFSQTACPWLFQLLCFHLKSSELMIQKYSYRNLFLLKAQYHTFISILQPSKSKIALSHKYSYKPSQHLNTSKEVIHFTFLALTYYQQKL